MDNSRSRNFLTRIGRRRFGVAIGIVAFLAMLDASDAGRVSAIGLGTLGWRFYINGGLSSEITGNYPGTNCAIYKETNTVSDTLPSFFDVLKDRYSSSFNETLNRYFSPHIWTQCGTITDPRIMPNDQIGNVVNG